MGIENHKRDDNYVPTPFVDMSTGLYPTKIYVDETTHRLLTNTVISGIPTVTQRDFDYLGVTNSGNTDTLTFKSGGSTGTTVRTLAITFASGAAKISDDIVSLEFS